MRFTNAGLTGLGPVIESLAGGAFDIGGLLMEQNPIIDQQDAFLTFDIVGNVYEAGIGGVTLTPQSTEGGVATPITIRRPLRGREPAHHRRRADQHRLRARAADPHDRHRRHVRPRAHVAGDESKVDVNMIGTPTVDTGTVDYEFISGICDSDSVRDRRHRRRGGRPAGPGAGGRRLRHQPRRPRRRRPGRLADRRRHRDRPGEISIAGSVGEAIQAHLDAPFTAIDETASAIDFRADADFFATPGATPADCVPVPGAPDLAATVDVPGEYPTLGDTTPGGAAVRHGAGHLGVGLQPAAGDDDRVRHPQPVDHRVRARWGAAAADHVVAARRRSSPSSGRSCRRARRCSGGINPTVAPFLTSEPGPNGEIGRADAGQPRGRRSCRTCPSTTVIAG